MVLWTEREKEMDFIGNLLGAGASAMTGGIFGMIGALLSGVAKYFQAKQEQDFKRQDQEHEKNLIELNMKALAHETENELAIASQKGSYLGLGKSLQAESSIGKSYRWVNAIRSLFRPLLTVSLLAISFLIFKDVMDAMDGEGSLSFDRKEARELLSYIVYSIIFSTSTAIVWWFGERSLMPSRLKDK